MDEHDSLEYINPARSLRRCWSKRNNKWDSIRSTLLLEEFDIFCYVLSQGDSDATS